MSSICIIMQMGIYALFWYGYYYSERMYLKFYFKGHLLMLFCLRDIAVFLFSDVWRYAHRVSAVGRGDVFPGICHALCQCHYVSADVSDGAGFLDIRPLFYMTLSEAAVIVLWTLEALRIYRRIFLPEICCWCTEIVRWRYSAEVCHQKGQVSGEQNHPHRYGCGGDLPGGRAGL